MIFDGARCLIFYEKFANFARRNSVMSIKSYIDKIFSLRIEQVKSPVMRRVVRFVRLFIYMLRSLLSHGTMFRSYTLTYYTLISIVPIVALAFAIVSSFGMMDMLIGNLYRLLPTMPEVVDLIVTFAEKALARTQGGLVAVVSIVMLFWSVISMFNSIESAFDNIWEVKHGRSIMRRVSNYITIFVVAPLLWVLSSYIGMVLSDIFSVGDSWLTVLAGKGVSIVIAWAMFTFLFIILPNTKVHFRPAYISALVTAIFFVLFQWLYVWLQSMMTSYNAIYGSFAALPLFLIWVSTSWQILLLGGELCFAVQNEKGFDEEQQTRQISYSQRRAVMLAIMWEVCNAFRKGEGGMAIGVLTERLHIPPRLLNQSLQRLCEAGLLHEIEREINDNEDFYAPARDIATLRIYDVLEIVDEKGYGNEKLHNPTVEQWNSKIEQIRQAARSTKENMLLMDITQEEYGK